MVPRGSERRQNDVSIQSGATGGEPRGNRSPIVDIEDERETLSGKATREDGIFVFPPQAILHGIRSKSPPVPVSGQEGYLLHEGIIFQKK